MAVRIDWQPGDVFLDHYRVERLLGTGGMGRVYRVEHRGWGIPLVVKVPRPELVDQVAHMLSFERECQTWIALGNHPNIVSCYFVRRYEALPLVFAEYAPFGSLHDWIVSGRLYHGGRRAALSRILDFAIQFAQGLSFAHQRGLVHQDVKPANVMIGANWSAKVTDFGLARAHAAIGQPARKRKSGTGVTAAGMTPAYCSPEQAANERLSSQSDVWSWAVSVMEMFTGGCHWMSGVAARDVLREHVRQQSGEDRQGHQIPRSLGMLLDSCFRTDPRRRPEGMDAIVQELQQIYTSVTGELYPRLLVSNTIDPTDPVSLANANNRAISSFELGQTDAALETLKEAELNAKAFGDLGGGTELQDLAYNQALLQIRTNPVYNVDYVPTLIPNRPNELRKELLVGMLFLEAGRVPAAIEQLTRPAQRSSEFQTEALNSRGIALLLAGETAPAILSFKAALELAPTRVECLRNLAIANYYHGDTYAALTLMERLSGEQRIDAADAVRFSAILSAAGQIRRSRELLEHLRLSGSPSPAMLCTAGEIGFGIQSFLPGLVPTSNDYDESRRWILEASAAEPTSLRAEIVRRRLPSRVVIRPEAPIQRGKRIPPDPNDPEEVADRCSASYEPIQKRLRWGEVPSPMGKQLRGLTTVATILCGVLGGLLLFDSASLIAVFGSDAITLRLACWSGLVAATAFVVLRRSAIESIARSIAVFGLLLPAGIFAPTLLHESYVHTHLNGSATAGNVQSMFWFLVQLSATIGALLFVRELPFRALGSRLRAWGAYARPRATRAVQSGANATTGITAIARLTQATRNMGAGALGYSTHGRTSRTAFWFDRLATSVPRAIPRIRAAYGHYQAKGGFWHLLLLPEFVSLALSDAMWAGFAPELPLVRYVGLSVAANLVLWLLIPTFARSFLVANLLLAPAIAAAFASNALPMAGNSISGAVGFAIMLLLLNGVAMRRCPAFAPMWPSVSLGQWNLQGFIDPLDLRRYAAPWRLIRVTNPVEKM